jgi:hypothetical protein
LLNAVLSNCTWEDREVVATFRQPFDLLAETTAIAARRGARNTAKSAKSDIKQIAASIERFGFNNPVLIADDGMIVAGHGSVGPGRIAFTVTPVPAMRLARPCFFSRES